MITEITTEYKEFKGYACSRIGGRGENQDDMGFLDTPYGLAVIICDGMGGGPGGKTASRIAVSTIGSFLKSAPEGMELSCLIEEAVSNAHDAIKQFADANPRLKGMGSTLAMAVFSDRCVTTAHVGDSRVYQLRGKKVVFRTDDHSHVMELYRQGLIRNEEDARLSPSSNIITRALGHGEKVRPDISELPYLKGDRFAVCTDGIWGMFPQKEIVKMIAGVKSPAGAVDRTVVSVDDYGACHGGNHDNLTLAVVDTETNSILKEKMRTLTKILIIALAVIAVASLLLNVFLLSDGKENNDGGSVEATTVVEHQSASPTAQSLDVAENKPAASVSGHVGNVSEKQNNTTKGGVSNKETENLLAAETAMQEILDDLESLKTQKDASVRKSLITMADKKLDALISLQGLDARTVGLLEKAKQELNKPITRKADDGTRQSSLGQINEIQKLIRRASSSTAAAVGGKGK